MESLLNRYRNVSVLLIVVAAQLMLIAYQVKTSKDVPLLRVWAVTAVTPVERVLEVLRTNTWGFVQNYFVLLNIRGQNDQLRKDMGQLKLENQYLKTELSTSDRVRSLAVFQSHSPSKTVAARIIGNGAGANSKVVFVDRGSGSEVESGMAVITPDGIVGKVVAAYPTASLVLLITDANFAAGVISQKNRVHGTLKGLGHDGSVLVDYVQNEEKIEPGEWFYTSGDDRIFPKGFPVGTVAAVRNGRSMKEIYVTPSGFQTGLEEVLIVLEAVHQPVPEVEVANPGYRLIPPPPDAADADAAAQGPAALSTDADRLKDQYRQVGDQTHYQYGEGYTSPDFTKLPGVREAGTPGAPKPGATAAPGIDGGLKPKKPDAPATEEPGVKPRPRPAAPLLITDPTDADPSETAVPAPPKKTDPEIKAKPKSNVP